MAPPRHALFVDLQLMNVFRSTINCAESTTKHIAEPPLIEEQFLKVQSVTVICEFLIDVA